MVSTGSAFIDVLIMNGLGVNIARTFTSNTGREWRALTYKPSMPQVLKNH